EAAVARERAGAGEHEVAHAGEASERFQSSSQRDAKLRHLMQPARDQRGVGVESEAEAFEHAGSDGDDVLQRAGDLDADDVGGVIEPESGAGKRLLHDLREVDVARGDDRRGWIAARHFERECRAGQNTECRELVAQHFLGHFRHAPLRIDLDSLRAGKDLHRTIEARLQLLEHAAIDVARNDHEQRVAERRRLVERVGRADVLGNGDLRQVERIGVRLRNRFREAGIVHPQKNLVVAARRDGGHRGTARPRAHHGNLHLRSPIFRSVPCASRAMLEWCFTMMAMEMTMLSATVQNGAWVRKRRKLGIRGGLSIEASETMRVARMTMAKTSSPAPSAFGSMARNAPVAVATPLPPWNFSQTGNMCASTAMTAASVTQNAVERSGALHSGRATIHRATATAA